MSARVQSQNVLSAIALIESLEPGEWQALHHVSWEEYEELLAELGEGCAVRVAYADGTLEIMAPLYRHEAFKDLISYMVRILTVEMKLRLQSAGSTTLKRKNLLRGAEPDTCFYIQNAQRMIGKQDIDLLTDPPPDLVVEIDITNPSGKKFETYAQLGVSELWRYDGAQLRIFGLSSEATYLERESSITFPFVTGETLTGFIEQSKTEGQDAALDGFQAWVRTHKPLP